MIKLLQTIFFEMTRISQMINLLFFRTDETQQTIALSSDNIVAIA